MMRCEQSSEFVCRGVLALLTFIDCQIQTDLIFFSPHPISPQIASPAQPSPSLKQTTPMLSIQQPETFRFQYIFIIALPQYFFHLFLLPTFLFQMSHQPNPAAFPPGFFFIQSQRTPTLTIDVNDGSMTVSAVTVTLF
jgi:hypothetical protein